MKTLRIAMIATFVALAMVSLANAGGIKANPVKPVLNISIVEAEHNAGLVAQMYRQISEELLNNNQLMYTVYVVYGNTVYRISGTYEQWSMFFDHRKSVPEKKTRPGAGVE